MRIIILCEGKTDAILLSYLMHKISNWEYTKDKNLWQLNGDDYKDESINWYKRKNDYLLICGVGGKSKFGKFFKDKLYQPIMQAKISFINRLCKQAKKVV